MRFMNRANEHHICWRVLCCRKAPLGFQSEGMQTAAKQFAQRNGINGALNRDETQLIHQ